jgi:hypothetical protein
MVVLCNWVKPVSVVIGLSLMENVIVMLLSGRPSLLVLRFLLAIHQTSKKVTWDVSRGLQGQCGSAAWVYHMQIPTDHIPRLVYP